MYMWVSVLERLQTETKEFTHLTYTGLVYLFIMNHYERLQTKTKEFTRLSYTELVLEVENLKIETRLKDERFESVKGEYVI